MWSPKSKNTRVQRAVFCAATALGRAQTMPRPAGSMSPFCDPATVARNTGGGLIVDYKNAFDCMRPVGPQGILNAIGRGPYPPTLRPVSRHQDRCDERDQSRGG